MENIVRMARDSTSSALPMELTAREDYEFAKTLGWIICRGHTYQKPLLIKTAKLDFLQGNFFQLVVAVTKDTPDMTEIEGDYQQGMPI